MSRSRLYTLVSALTVTFACMAVTAAPVTAVPVPAPRFAPPSQRVYMVSDSVGLGAKDYLADAFPADWQVVVDGKPAQFVEKLESLFVKPAIANHPQWFGDHVVVAGGYNYPYWDPARFDRSIDSMINTLTEAGVKYVHWVTLREVKQEYVSPGAWRDVQKYNFYFPTVNRHLRDALERHPSLRLVEWAWAADRAGITYDAIHLNVPGARLYSSLIRESVVAAEASVPDGSITRVDIPGAAGNAAAVVNLTTVGPRQYGFLTAWACDGPPPTVSVHNYARAQTVAHTAIVPLDATGGFCVFTRSATHLVVDVTGLFPASGAFEVTAPTRWLDTRELGGPVAAASTTLIDLDDVSARAGVPVGTDVAAVALTLTAVGAQSPGFLTATPCGTSSDTSNVNYLDQSPSPNLVVVAPNEGGEICITSLASTHIIVDLFGVIATEPPAANNSTANNSTVNNSTGNNSTVTSSADVDLAVVDPAQSDSASFQAEASRVLDSRESGGAVPAGTTLTLDVGVSPGVVLNLTAVGAMAPGYLSAYPCASGRPNTSSLNVLNAFATSNAAIVAPDADGHICVFSLSSTHVIVDVQATMPSAFSGIVPIRVLDTRR